MKRPRLTFFAALDRHGCVRALVVSLIGVAMFVGPASARTNPKAFMTWHAPVGSARATDTLSAPCDMGVERQDTLVICFTTGRNAERLYGLEAMLKFHAPKGDTLGPSWWFGGGKENPSNIWIEFPDSLPGARRPWKVPGVGAPAFTRTPTVGSLRLVYAVAESALTSVPDSTLFLFSRVLVPRPRFGVPRCDQPICIELESLRLYFQDDGGTPAKIPSPFVTWNGSGPRACTGSLPKKTAAPKPRPAPRKPK